MPKARSQMRPHTSQSRRLPMTASVIGCWLVGLLVRGWVGGLFVRWVMLAPHFCLCIYVRASKCVEQGYTHIHTHSHKHARVHKHTHTSYLERGCFKDMQNHVKIRPQIRQHSCQASHSHKSLNSIK